MNLRERMLKKIRQEDMHQTMRGYFAGYLYNSMIDDSSIYLIVGDLGYKVFDNHFKDFSDRCINTGAAEQAMMGIACGLALEGKKPFVYSITTFLLYRPFETIKLYINAEQIPVRLIGSGRNKDYAHDGPSHDASDIKLLFGGSRAGEGKGLYNNIIQYWPDTKEEILELVDKMVKLDKPQFISLRR